MSGKDGCDSPSAFSDVFHMSLDLTVGLAESSVLMVAFCLTLSLSPELTRYLWPSLNCWSTERRLLCVIYPQRCGSNLLFFMVIKDKNRTTMVTFLDLRILPTTDLQTLNQENRNDSLSENQS